MTIEKVSVSTDGYSLIYDEEVPKGWEKGSMLDMRLVLDGGTILKQGIMR